MLRTLTLSLLLAPLPVLVNAQDLLTLTDEDGADVTNTTINVDITSDLAESTVSLTSVLNGSVNRTVHIKRYELEAQAGSENYFCWYECYAPTYAGDLPEWIAPDPQPLVAGNPFYGFHAYYRPNGTVGTSGFRFVWYTDAAPNDTVYVDILFNSAPTGVAEVGARDARFSAFPNPAVGADVQFSFENLAPTSRARLTFHSMLGSLVLVKNLQSTQRTAVLHRDELPAGVWFATLEVDGKAVVTRRVVLSGR